MKNIQKVLSIVMALVIWWSSGFGLGFEGGVTFTVLCLFFYCFVLDGLFE